MRHSDVNKPCFPDRKLVFAFFMFTYAIPSTVKVLHRAVWSACLSEELQTEGIIILEYGSLGPVKVKFTLEKAMKAQRGSRGIAILFL